MLYPEGSWSMNPLAVNYLFHMVINNMLQKEIILSVIIIY